MRVPLAWLAEYVPLADEVAPGRTPAEQVAADLVQVGLEEEAIHGGGVSGPLVVGRVLERVPEKQKNGKTISWCQVDVGPEHAPEGGGPRGIVCGAPNFEAGDLVVVCLPGAVLAGGFAISARKTYGHISDGMICSELELGMSDNHEGIIVLTELLGEQAAAELTPGQDAIALLGLDEQTVEVNVTPDRGYCFSVRGVAREYASATGRPAAFADPAAIETPPATPDGFRVEVDDTAPINDIIGCDRFVTRVVRGVDPAASSPAWLRKRVEQVGMRSISLAVDATNYVMMGLGQPLHAYDLGAVHEPITVRRARAGEKLITLDDVTRELHCEDLLITDAGGEGGENGSRIIGLAGVMGGASTEISESTTDMLIEAAHFDPVTVARTARRHKLPSEASKRFERGVDPRLPAAAAELVVQLLVEYGGGVADAAVGDLDTVAQPAPITMDADLPARLVGTDVSEQAAIERLREVGCQVEAPSAGTLLVTPPSWRPDLVQDADLVEEVARLEGYDKIPSVLPVAPAGRGLSAAQRMRRTVARTLVDLGWDEVLTYPFVSRSVFDQLAYPADDPRRAAVALANPLSDEAPIMRTTVLASLVEAVRRNMSRGVADLALVELGLVTDGSTPPVAGQAPVLRVDTRPDQAELDALVAAVPAQPLHVAGIACGQAEAAGWWGPGRHVDLTDAIAAARAVLDRLAVEVSVAPADLAPWHPGRCAALTTREGAVVGHAGELHPRVCEALGLAARSVAFELDLDVAFAAVSDLAKAEPVSPHPVVKEDVALIVDASTPAQAVAHALTRGGGELLESVRLFDVYTGPQVGEGKKSLAFALRMRAGDRTLKAEEAATVRKAAVAMAEKEFGAQLRGA